MKKLGWCFLLLFVFGCTPSDDEGAPDTGPNTSAVQNEEEVLLVRAEIVDAS